MDDLHDDVTSHYAAMQLKFTDECGIHRHHTTWNRPQQNGADISAMLFEANLPLSLWREALSTQIVGNQR